MYLFDQTFYIGPESGKDAGFLIAGVVLAALLAAFTIGLVFYVLQSVGLFVTASVFLYIDLYKVYQSCQPSNALLFLLLSIFVSISQPIILFLIRNKEEGMGPVYQNSPCGGGVRL